MEQLEWVVISYILPKVPSRIKVAFWRELREAGAININHSVWILPYTLFKRNFASSFKFNVIKAHGDALIMHSRVDLASEINIIKRMNETRDIEYEHIIGKCNLILNEMIELTERQVVTFYHEDIFEKQLKKLHIIFKRIVARDFFNSPKQAAASDKLAQCTHAIAMYDNAIGEKIKQLSLDQH